ncbi:uncharacterized protein LOC108215676 isoform X3 [Daucus carota subsp. sativus]|uniref:uncharacterized protein LOC108215676 isoform X3 n=1 Tax=Daucus carota subsp. sativus TaxID=79200 RepID=UPI0030832572
MAIGDIGADDLALLEKKQDNQKHQPKRDVMQVACGLWTDGLICAFESVQSRRKRAGSKFVAKTASAQRDTVVKQTSSKIPPTKSSRQEVKNTVLDSVPLAESVGNYNDPLVGHDSEHDCLSSYSNPEDKYPGRYWKPIGWSRISELVQTVQVDTDWASQPIEFADSEDDISVAEIAAPYWEQPVGPTWWCHVIAGHPSITAWLSNAQWLHPAISTALRDESKLISERMKHLFYEVPVRVAGGLLFELLGQSAGDPFAEEDDIPVVMRSWQAQNFLVTTLHVKGSASNVNVLGVAEVQELLTAGGSNVPQTIHEVIALLACRLARWDDRRNHEDMHLFTVILNQEIRRLSTQVIRVKWSLHAREEIIFELLQHLRGNATRNLLEGIRKSTRAMIGEQEAVRGRLFTIQDVMQSTVRAWLQDKSLHITHNLGVFGGCGLVLSIVTGLFGINVDGIPGNEGTPYAFALFSGLLLLLGVALIAMGLVYLGLKRPVAEEQVQVRKLELQELVKMFQHEAESHAQVRKSTSHNTFASNAASLVRDGEEGYILID